MTCTGTPSRSIALPDRIAGGAGNFGHDRELLAGEPIEQARLADVRLARSTTCTPSRSRLPCRDAAEHRVELRRAAGEPLAAPAPLEEVDLFLGKIERRFDEHAQLDELLARAS